jgi:hypothetical protein
MSNETNILSNIRYQTKGQALNVAIEACTNAISYKKYDDFLHKALCLGKLTTTCSSKKAKFNDALKELKVFEFKGAHNYNVLKIATEMFLLLNNCGNVRNCISRNCVSEGDYSEKRLGRITRLDELQNELTQYIDEYKALPYIGMILKNLFTSGYFEDTK